MRKIITLGFIFCFFGNSFLFSQDYGQGFSGIVSQVFDDRYYDRVFDLDFAIADPTAMGMGGAFVAVANDAQATLWNPAGLTRLTKIQGQVVIQLDFDQRLYTEAENSGIKVLSEPKPLFTFPSLALVLPFSIQSRNLALGFSYLKLNNANSEVEDTEYYFGGSKILEVNERMGGTDAVSTSIAFELIEQLSLGFTYNYLFGNDDFDFRIKSPYADNITYLYFSDKEEVSGNFVNIGILANPLKWISLGANITPSWTYTIKENKEKIVSLSYDSDVGYSELVFETPEDELEKFEFKQPLKFDVGVAIKPIQSLTLAMSYEMDDWEGVEIIRNDEKVDNNMTNVASWRYGLEYLATSGVTIVPLRLGYYTHDLPFKDMYFEGTYYGQQIERTYWTLGIGMYKEKVKIDFAYQNGIQEFSKWMRSQDYYNDRLFKTKDTFNQVLLKVTYEL